MQKYKYIFIVVTFRNAEDLFEFNESIKNNISNYKIIIVNSFFDEETEKRIKKIAKELNCDFLSVINKGYGYGNNRGIEYANKKYNYDYLIISNSDIIIKQFDESSLSDKQLVCGPDITTISNKKQNPFYVMDSHLIRKLYYFGFKYNYVLLVLGIFLNKLLRIAYKIVSFFSKKNRAVYAIHGSFIIISKDVIQELYPIFDEKMFLYNEEEFLAFRLKKREIRCFVNYSIKIIHKEDGSTVGLDFNSYKYAKESYIYLYDNYLNRKNNTNV